MATSRRQPSAPLKTLFEQPQQFDFFQAVRMLELITKIDDQTLITEDNHNTQTDETNIQNKHVRFGTFASSLSYPIGDIALIKEDTKKFIHTTHDFIELYVTFLGLTGPNGALPDTYTELIKERLHFHDHSLQDFFNLFNHRILTLFYKAWKKYHFNIGYEDAKRGTSSLDTFREMVLCLIGKGAPHLRNRLPAVPDDAFVYYSGIIAKQSPSAEGLIILLKGYFKLPIQIEQLKQVWLNIESDDLTRLGHCQTFDSQYNQLGMDAIIGKRVLDIKSTFRIVIGPLHYQQFIRLIPSGDIFLALCEMVRHYLPLGLNFDMQLILTAAEVPTCELRDQTKNPFCLGWNSWLGTTQRNKDADDLVLNSQ